MEFGNLELRRKKDKQDYQGAQELRSKMMLNLEALRKKSRERVESNKQ